MLTLKTDPFLSLILELVHTPWKVTFSYFRASAHPQSFLEQMPTLTLELLSAHHVFRANADPCLEVMHALNFRANEHPPNILDLWTALILELMPTLI